MFSRPVGDLRTAPALPGVVPAIATSHADRSGHIVPAHPQTCVQTARAGGEWTGTAIPGPRVGGTDNYGTKEMT